MSASANPSIQYGAIPRRYFGEGIVPLRPTLPAKPVYINTFEDTGTSSDTDKWFTTHGTLALDSTHVLAGKNSPYQSLLVTGAENMSGQPIFINLKLGTPFAAATCAFPT